MASFERNPGKPVRATFYLLVTIANPVRTRSHRQQIEPLDIQSYLPPGTFRMVILPMPSRIRHPQRYRSARLWQLPPGLQERRLQSGRGRFLGTRVAEFAFGPEAVDAVELGLKSDWSLGELAGRTNLAVYKSWYNDAQVLNNVVIGVASTTATQHAAKATITGFEVEGEVRLARQFSLTSTATLDCRAHMNGGGRLCNRLA